MGSNSEDLSKHDSLLSIQFRAKISENQSQHHSEESPRSSNELTLGESAQRLLVLNHLSLLQGLRQPSPDPEELEVAAFCMQWRRKLRRHRLQETSDLDCDELGLRKTSTEGPPTLVALVQEAL